MPVVGVVVGVVVVDVGVVVVVFSCILFLVQIFELKIRGNVFLDSINVSHCLTQKFAKFR